MENVSLEEHNQSSTPILGEKDCQTKDFVSFINPFKQAIQRFQKGNKLYRAYLKGTPKITNECIKSSEYEFENGLRKVRYVTTSLKNFALVRYYSL